MTTKVLSVDVRAMTVPWRACCIAVCLVLSSSSGAADLVEVYKQGLEQDPQYQQVQATHEAIRETYKQARARLLFPTLNFNANVARNFQALEQGFGVSGDLSFTNKRYVLSLTQPIFHFDRYRTLEQTDFQTREAMIRVDVAHQDLIIRVVERYLDVLAAIDGLNFALAETEALMRQLDQSNQRFEVGLIAITDVQEAQAGFDLARAEEIEAENTIEDAREALREVTNQDHEALASLNDEIPLLVPTPEDIDAWAERALVQNLDMAAAQANMQAARAEIRIQRAGHLPSLDLVADRSISESGGRFGDTEIDNTAIGLQLQVPIFEGGQVLSRSREAAHRYQVAMQQFEQQKRRTLRETRDAYRGVVSGISRVKAFNQAVVSSTVAVEATEIGFAVGTRTAVDVVNVERELSRARRDYARARYDYILDILRLKRGAGTLSPEDLEQVNGWFSEQ